MRYKTIEPQGEKVAMLMDLKKRFLEKMGAEYLRDQNIDLIQFCEIQRAKRTRQLKTALSDEWMEKCWMAETQANENNPLFDVRYFDHQGITALGRDRGGRNPQQKIEWQRR